MKINQKVRLPHTTLFPFFEPEVANFAVKHNIIVGNKVVTSFEKITLQYYNYPPFLPSFKLLRSQKKENI